MLAFLGNIFGGVWSKIIIVTAAVVAVLTILAGARSAGRDSERVKNAKQAIEIIKRQRQAAARSPADRSGAADRMRDGTF